MSNNSEYQYIDLEYINEIAGEEDEFVIEIINNYLDSNPSYILELENAVNAKDYTAIMFFAHKAKGSFKFIGATQLSNLAEQIEIICDGKGSFDAINEYFQQVKAVAPKAIEELKTALAKFS